MNYDGKHFQFQVFECGACFFVSVPAAVADQGADAVRDYVAGRRTSDDDPEYRDSLTILPIDEGYEGRLARLLAQDLGGPVRARRVRPS